MKRKQLLPLILVFCLIFLWAISSNLLPTMIRQLMKTCELNAFEASFTETAYWLAYFICPIPIAMFMKRYSYKSGIVFGLLKTGDALFKKNNHTRNRTDNDENANHSHTHVLEVCHKVHGIEGKVSEEGREVYRQKYRKICHKIHCQYLLFT